MLIGCIEGRIVQTRMDSRGYIWVKIRPNFEDDFATLRDDEQRGQHDYVIGEELRFDDKEWQNALAGGLSAHVGDHVRAHFKGVRVLKTWKTQNGGQGKISHFWIQGMSIEPLRYVEPAESEEVVAVTVEDVEKGFI